MIAAAQGVRSGTARAAAVAPTGRSGRLPSRRRDRSPSAAPTEERPNLIAAALVTAVVVMAGVGTVLAVQMLLQPAPSELTVLRTQAATVEVDALSVTAGHRPEDMIGMPAGAQGPDDQVQATVAATITNTSDAPVPYSAGQFRLVTAADEAAPGGPSAAAPPRMLRPGAAVTLRLSFVVTTLDQPRLRYAPADGAPATAALTTPDGASSGGHAHDSHAPDQPAPGDASADRPTADRPAHEEPAPGDAVDDEPAHDHSSHGHR